MRWVNCSISASCEAAELHEKPNLTRTRSEASARALRLRSREWQHRDPS
jgi:hypothetical protein